MMTHVEHDATVFAKQSPFWFRFPREIPAQNVTTKQRKSKIAVFADFNIRMYRRQLSK